jgi:hypothetical protein
MHFNANDKTIASTLKNFRAIYKKDFKIADIKVDLKSIKKIMLDHMKSIVDNVENPDDVKIIKDIKSMTFCCGLELSTSKFPVRFFIIGHEECLPIMTQIAHLTFIMIELLSDKTSSEPLTIYIVLDDNLRELMNYKCDKCDVDYKNLSLHSKAFNVSGFTDDGTNTIFLTRKQEVLKLLAHELIHYLHKDYDLRTYRMHLPWKFSTNYKFYETYTESLSIIIHTMYVACRTGEDYGDLMNIELEYSYELTANILKWFGFTKKTYKSFFEGAAICKQPIYIAEYIIMRAYVLTDFQTKFIDASLKADKKMLAYYEDKLKSWIPNLDVWYDLPYNKSVSYIVHDISHLRIS